MSSPKKPRFTAAEDAAIREGRAAGMSWLAIAADITRRGLGERTEVSVYMRGVKTLKLPGKRVNREKSGEAQAAKARPPAFKSSSAGVSQFVSDGPAGLGGRVRPCFNLLCPDGQRRMIGFHQASALAAQIRAGRANGESDAAIADRLKISARDFANLLRAVGRDKAMQETAQMQKGGGAHV